MNTGTPHKQFRRTRLAPTPSGYLHLGNIFSFVLTAALARRTGAQVLLRIDDMDRDRVAPAYLQDIFDTLHFLEIPCNEGPKNVADFEAHFAQRHRASLYDGALQQLASGGHVFACTCSRSQLLRLSADGRYTGTCRNKELPLDTPGCAWRLRTDATQLLAVRSWKENRAPQSLPPALHDFIVRKKDGCAAYQLSSLVDDAYFEVDLVVRGADLWGSTLAQTYLAALLGIEAFRQVCFVHHPLMTDEKGMKMSKSAGATSVYQLRKSGKQRAAVYAELGRMIGLDVPVSDWSSMAAAMAQKGIL